MIRHRFVSLLAVFLLTLAAIAQQQPAARVIDLKASDGTILKASYFAAAKSGPGVLLLHQCNRQRKVWDDVAGQLAAAGINVLTFDLRGFGESGGSRFDKLTPQENGAGAGREMAGRHSHRLSLSALAARRHARCDRRRGSELRR